MNDDVGKLIGRMIRRMQKQANAFQAEAKWTVMVHYGLKWEDVDVWYHGWMALRARYEQETGKKLP